MIAAILSIIMAIVSYFTAKKKTGASDTQAALVAAAAGAGTYYVATETEWGKSAVASLESGLGIDKKTEVVTKGDPVVKEVVYTAADGTIAKDVITTQTNSDGSVTTTTNKADGTTTTTVTGGQFGTGEVRVTKDSSGNTVYVPVTKDGTPKSTSVLDVLKDWGATGTATVIGTTGAVTNPNLTKYLPWAAGALVLILLVR